jgi:diguanylate cyclase (GGDEF)-like protein
VVRPDAVAPWTFEPPVVITSLRIGGKALPAAQGEGAPDRLDVSSGANSIMVEFSALDYSAPDRNLYRYRLDGYDRDWVQTDSAHRFAAYTNLPPGDYNLRLAGSNRNGVWTGRETTLHVRVLPAWFQTIWFRLVECVGAGALVAILVHARTVFLRRRQRELEHQVAERTSELSESQKQLRQLAYFDSLTALPNRRAFNEECARMVAAAAGEKPFALVMADLDGFKKVNDTLGHDAGDDVLVVAAGRLREAVRDGDFVARLGGDEFAVILSGIRDQDGADLVCERICRFMAEPVTVKSAAAKIGASVGVALCPRDGRTQEQLYKLVDLALYDAKRAGRGTWRWYNESLLTQ